jgi:AcrR family transcriptional regulator
MADRAQGPAPTRARRPTRAETRARLVAAALEVFLAKGFAATSVEDVAERAGFSRGAVYSNFADKDELFLAVMDDQLGPRVDDVRTIVAGASPLDLILRLRAWRGGADPPEGWTALQEEFRTHALRDPRAREQLAERNRAVRRAYERAIEGQFAALGLTPPAPTELIALLIHALDGAAPVLHHLDPDTVPKDFFFDALELLFRAGVALASQTEP